MDRDEQRDDEGKRLLNTIITNAKKMGQLIDDLLHFSRIGKKDVNRTLINLDQLVQEVALQLKTHDYEKTIIETDHLGKVMADFTLTQLIFQNLISNALKYSSKKDKPFIEIGMKMIDNNKTYFIKDNGAGFNMEYYDKLFSVFHRLHRQDEFEGTGVGLAIVKKIVERHGGLIWAEGEPGKGAIFYFTLNS